MPPPGVGVKSRAVDSAWPSFPFPRDNIFFRFLHLTSASINKTRNAKPATLPTTLPTTTEVGGVDDPELEPPAASVLDGDALDGAAPVAPPAIPPPPALVEVACAEEDKDEVNEVEVEVVELPDEDDSKVRYVSEDLEDEDVEFEQLEDKLLELNINEDELELNGVAESDGKLLVTGIEGVDVKDCEVLDTDGKDCAEILSGWADDAADGGAGALLVMGLAGVEVGAK
jgi:hypothetical protein